MVLFPLCQAKAYNLLGLLREIADRCFLNTCFQTFAGWTDEEKNHGWEGIIPGKI